MLDPVGRLEPSHHLAYGLQTVRVQVVAPKEGAQSLALVGTGDAPGLREECGGPMAAYVIGVGLAGVPGVPEQAEEVVLSWKASPSGSP